MDTASLAEVIGVLCGVAGVWLTIRQNVWCWPFGIVNVSLFAVVFYQSRLYGSAALQLVYLALSLYGWYAWVRGGVSGRGLTVSRMPRRWRLPVAVAGSLFAVGLGWLLRTRTDAALPFVDGATTSFSLIAQWMTTRKWIGNWLIWIAVDVVYVGMYLSQGLYPTSGLYVVFLGLAVAGYREWARSMTAAPRVAP